MLKRTLDGDFKNSSELISMPAKRTYKKRSYGKKVGSRLPYAEYLLARSLAKRRKDLEIAGVINDDIAALRGATVSGGGPGVVPTIDASITNRRRPFRGSGSYWSDAVGELQGGARALLEGGQAGLLEHVGQRLAASPFWSKLTGRGAYSTGGHPGAVNQLINPTSTPHVMSSVADETGDVIMSHSEFIQDIIPSSSGFQSQAFLSINPGLASSFPYLSQLAAYYEEYEFIQLVYEYRSVLTDGNASAAGTVIMATQYNPTSAAFTQKINMEQYEHSQSLAVNRHGLHGVECEPGKTSQSGLEYIRTGPVPSNQDIKTFDKAVFQLATSGVPAGNTTTYGELWVHYTVRLSKAKLNLPGQVSNIPMLDCVINYTSTAANPFSQTNLLGSSWLGQPGGGYNGTNGGTNFVSQFIANSSAYGTYTGYDTSGGISFIQGYGTLAAAQAVFPLWGNALSGLVVVFPTWVTSGKYMVQITVKFATAQTANPTIISGTPQFSYYNGQPTGTQLGSFQSKAVTANTEVCVYQAIVKVSSPTVVNSAMLLPAWNTTTYATGDSMSLRIFQIADNSSIN